MLGAFAALVLVTTFGWSVWPALLGAMLICALLGVVLERIAFAPLRRRPDTHLSGLISSIAVATMFEAFALWRFAGRPQRFPEGTLHGQSLPEFGDSIFLLQLLHPGVGDA